MSWLAISMVILLALIETLASYISRVYAEFGKILSREVQENLDAWEEQIEPHLGLTREHAAISAAVLQQLALGVIALEFGAVLFDRGPHMGRPTYRRDRASRAGRGAGGRLLQPGAPLAAFRAHQGDAGRFGCCGPFACCYG